MRDAVDAVDTTLLTTDEDVDHLADGMVAVAYVDPTGV